LGIVLFIKGTNAFTSHLTVSTSLGMSCLMRMCFRFLHFPPPIPPPHHCHSPLRLYLTNLLILHMPRACCLIMVQVLLVAPACNCWMPLLLRPLIPRRRTSIMAPAWAMQPRLLLPRLPRRPPHGLCSSARWATPHHRPARHRPRHRLPRLSLPRPRPARRRRRHRLRHLDPRRLI
jgi:hypothetical protein